ncbi:armadillo-type protein [Myxozyma melibiosi]|uniref:Armadillo-type protein n=1 Tax=Myxozyma melibiosi TaxID=54550 RepID=A0ABR1F2M0_9ASCO
MADPQFALEISNLLEQITAPNSEVIKAASSKLQKEYYVSEKCVPALIQIIQQSPSVQLRQLAAIEARKLVPAYWDELDAGLKAQIRMTLFQSTLQEPVSIVRHASSRVISEIAKCDLPNNEWVELPSYVQKAATSSAANEREVGVYLLYSLLESMDPTFTEKIGDFLTLFSQTINDPESQTVRTDTLLALGKIAEIIDTNSEHVAVFRQFLPSMVNVLKQLIEAGDTKALNQAFDVFQTLLWIESGVIGKSLGDLMQFMLELAKEPSADSEARILALQFLTNAVRFKRMKIQGLRIGPTLTSTAMSIAAESMDEIDEDAEEDSVPRLALRFIDMMSSTLPPSQVMNTLLSEIPKYLSSPNPNYRRAGLLALSVAAEGSPEFLATQLKFVLPVILQGLQDSVLEVRGAALSALAQLAEELQESISKEHETLLPLVFNMMDTSDLKVGKAACTALDAMVETMEKDVISKYLDTLMTRLIELLHQPASDISIKGPIIAAIGSAAHASQENFLPYFNTTVHALEPFLALTEGEAELDVKGMAFDAMSSMATAVGKEAFNPFASALVETAYQCFSSKHSRLRECVYLFFGCLAKIYGEEFGSFLPRIMPELFKVLEQEETGFEENDDVEVGDVDEADWNNITINSALAIEKEIAIDVLGDFAAGTKTAFLPYMEEASQLMLGLVSHFYEGIRKAAIGSLWQTVGVVYNISNPPKWQPGLPVKVPVAESVTTYSEMVMKATLEAFDEEDDRSVATVICDNFCEIIRLCGPAIVGNNTEAICTQVLAVLKKQHQCQTMEDDPEDEEYEDSAEYDVMLIESAMDCVVSLAAALGGDFTEYFRTFFPILQKFCSSSSVGERKAGVGALAEIVNGLKGAVTPWTTQLLKTFTHRLSDESIDVRSNAVYGYGMLAEYSQSSQEITATYTKTFQRLQQLLVSDAESARCIANICGCVARMCSAHPESAPIDAILPPLVYKLPLTDGFEENDPIFRLIVQLYQGQNATVQSLTGEILKALEVVFANDSEESKQFEHDATRNDVVQLLKYIYSTNPSSIPADSILAKTVQG